MMRFNSLTLSVLILSAGLVHAQTGPTGPVVPTPPSNNNNLPPVQQLTPERLDNYLRSKGHSTKINRHNNGVIIIAAQIQQDGWRFDVEIEFGGDQKNFNLTCKLGSPQGQLAPAQLMALMKKNYDMGALMHFCYREADRQLCLDAPRFPTIMNEMAFQNALNDLLRLVRETHPLWDTSRWPMTQVASDQNISPLPAPAAPVNPPVTPPQPKITSSLVGTTWIGSESLETYGRLEFRFGPNGQVVMIDAAGESTGSYNVQGNTVTLTFHGGKCIYTGTINGQEISGSAQAGGKTWTFSVRC